MIIAIDPGAAGGIAHKLFNGTVGAIKMPDTDSLVVAHIASLMKSAGVGETIVVVVEKVGGYVGTGAVKYHTCPKCKFGVPVVTMGQPGSAMFTFGHGHGVLIGAILALGGQLDEPRPQTWQKALSCGSSKTYATKSEWKGHLKDMAQKLFPCIKVTNYSADALLMLEYGRRLFA